MFLWSNPAFKKRRLSRRENRTPEPSGQLLDGLLLHAGGGQPDSIGKCVLLLRYAEKLVDHGILFRQQFEDFRIAYPGLRIRLRVVDDELHRQGVMVHALVALNQVHLLAMRITIEIEPAFVVETDRVNYKCVSIPFANRIPQPGRFQILRVPSPVSPDLAPKVLALEEHEHSVRSLNDLMRLRKKQNARNPGRGAL